MLASQATLFATQKRIPSLPFFGIPAASPLSLLMGCSLILCRVVFYRQATEGKFMAELLPRTGNRVDVP